MVVTLTEWLNGLPDDPNFAWDDDEAVEALIASMPKDVKTAFDAEGDRLGVALAAAVVKSNGQEGDLPEEAPLLDTPMGTVAVLIPHGTNNP